MFELLINIISTNPYIFISIIALIILLFTLVILRKKLKKHHRKKAKKSKNNEHKEEDKYDQNLQRLPSKDEKNRYKQDEKVVDFAKPVGFWTKKIWEEKMQHLMHLMDLKKEGQSYWQNYVGATKADDKKKGSTRSR